jgi:hypothetical protein
MTLVGLLNPIFYKRDLKPLGQGINYDKKNSKKP